MESYPGTFNIAGDGVLMLSQAIARAGRLDAPLPRALASVAREVGRRFGLLDFSAEQIEFLKYGRGLDTTKMRTVLGFEPRYSTSETFNAFVERHRLGRVLPLEVLDAVESGLTAAVGQLPGTSR